MRTATAGAKKRRGWERVEPNPRNEVAPPNMIEGVLMVKRYYKPKRLLQMRMTKKMASLESGTLTLFKYKRSQTEIQQYLSLDMADVQLHYHTKQPKLLIDQNTMGISVRVDKKDFDHWLKAFTDHFQYRNQQRAKAAAEGQTTAKTEDSLDDQKKSARKEIEPEVKKGEQGLAATNLSAVDLKFDEALTKLMAVNARLDEVTTLRDQLLKITTLPQNRQREASLLVQLALQEVVETQKALAVAFEALRLTLEMARGPRPTRVLGTQQSENAIAVGLMEKMIALINGQQKLEEQESESDEFEDEDSQGMELSDLDESERGPAAAPEPDAKTPEALTPNLSQEKLSAAKEQVKEQTKEPEIRKVAPVVAKKPAWRKEQEKSAISPAGIYIKRRSLPASALPPPSISLKTVFNRSMTLPITLFEPVNMLQIGAEEMRFSELLDRAANDSDPVHRMCYITAFGVTPYGNTINRARKPFNPLLFETYELDRLKELGWKYFAEQVSHHPDVSACHVEGNGWTYHQTARFTLHPTFSGIEIRPDADFRARLHLRRFDEMYTWTKVTSILQNVLKPSERKLTHQGMMDIRCSNGIRGTVVFTKGRERRINGSIVKGTNLLARVEGQWAGDIHRVNKGLRSCIFKSPSFSTENLPKFYGFSPFTMELNELPDFMRGQLPPTDSRLRPDQRCMEEGRFDEAQKVKAQLEQKQRERRQRTEKGMEPARQPLWFVPDQSSTGIKKCWISNGKYWAAKENGFKNLDFCPLWPST